MEGDIWMNVDTDGIIKLVIKRLEGIPTHNIISIDFTDTGDEFELKVRTAKYK